MRPHGHLNHRSEPREAGLKRALVDSTWQRGRATEETSPEAWNLQTITRS